MSQSARAKRMARAHERHKPASISLVSMMDIFTILVFFLLVNSADVQTLEPPETVSLPESIAQDKPRETVVVTVTNEQVLVQGEPVARVADIDAQPGNLIAPLAAALRGQSDRLLQRAAASDLSAREITILGDRGVPYRVLKKVMATCTEADYGKLSLAVLQKEEAMGAASGGA
ncbi:MAG: biopolymer transporter ExbD [Steroidobacteraceae bacterium]|nr:biopolymer transporter ExbD [Steroidobacteraceae bacterium]